MTNKSRAQKFILEGIDGGDSLGFLAAIGVLVAVSHRFKGATLGWTLQGSWRPVL